MQKGYTVKVEGKRKSSASGASDGIHRGRKMKQMADDENLIVGILNSFLEADDWSDFRAYIHHVRFDLCSFHDAKDLIPAWLGHYRLKQGVYDVDRATNDLATFPPIAARIAELKAEKG